MICQMGIMDNTDPLYMRTALELAAKAKGFTSPNPCVGAVVVKDDRIIGKGFHRAAGLPHAEVEAIDDALSRDRSAVPGSTIYVTLEPCNHFGKTPPCTHKILDAGITRVVVGCKDPNPYVSGGGIRFLKENKVTVTHGICRAEAETLIEDFIWYTRNNKQPFVILKAAATLDGYIATSTGDSKWITGEAARARGHLIRHEVDAILIGTGTLHADDPSLTARIAGQNTRDPIRVILDRALTIRPDARIITQDSNAKTIVVSGPHAPCDKKQQLADLGVEVIEADLCNGKLDLNQVMIKLGNMSILSVLIEGGGSVAASALRAGIVNKMHYFAAPKFLGGNDGIPVFRGKGPIRICDALEMDRVRVDRFGPDIMVTGYLGRKGD